MSFLNSIGHYSKETWLSIGQGLGARNPLWQLLSPERVRAISLDLSSTQTTQYPFWRRLTMLQL